MPCAKKRGSLKKISTNIRDFLLGSNGSHLLGNEGNASQMWHLTHSLMQDRATVLPLLRCLRSSASRCKTAVRSSYPIDKGRTTTWLQPGSSLARSCRDCTQGRSSHAALLRSGMAKSRAWSSACKLTVLQRSILQASTRSAYCCCSWHGFNELASASS